MKAIVNVDKNWGIGNGSDLLFHISADMKYFKEKTVGNVVVMGLKTFLSFPRQEPLKDRINIVLTHSDFKRDGVITVHSTDELTEELKKYESDKIFIIGGASVYAQFLDLCTNIYVTKVHSEKPADKFFPNLDTNSNFTLTFESEIFEEKGINFQFTEYTHERSC